MVESNHGLLHRSGHSALKLVPFVMPIFRDFATSLVASETENWYWDLSNEHMTSGGRKFYYNKGKVLS